MLGRRYAYADGSAPTAGRGSYAVARAVRAIGGIIVALIVIGILLVVLKANPHNDIVSFFTDIARWLTTPFHNLFSISDHTWHVIVNWGIAALVYGGIASLIARLAAR
jgi:Ni,Fe-hydrogenase I cytochrome b subunit